MTSYIDTYRYRLVRYLMSLTKDELKEKLKEEKSSDEHKLFVLAAKANSACRKQSLGRKKWEEADTNLAKFTSRPKDKYYGDTKYEIACAQTHYMEIILRATVDETFKGKLKELFDLREAALNKYMTRQANYKEIREAYFSEVKKLGGDEEVKKMMLRKRDLV